MHIHRDGRLRETQAGTHRHTCPHIPILPHSSLPTSFLGPVPLCQYPFSINEPHSTQASMNTKKASFYSCLWLSAKGRTRGGEEKQVLTQQPLSIRFRTDYFSSLYGQKAELLTLSKWCERKDIWSMMQTYSCQKTMNKMLNKSQGSGGRKHG